MKIKFLSVLLTLAPVYGLFSQNCPTNYTSQWEWPTHSNWFFGEGTYLNFPNGTGSPTFFYKNFTQSAESTNQPYEGTATVSDNNGNLLAYTNGRSLWDASGSLISNGLLAGNEDGGVNQRSSAVQGVTSVRHPLNPNLVYIFTTDDALNDQTTLGFNYSVYDLSTNTMSAPVRLKDDLGNNYRTTEQVNATFHSNGFDVWIIVRQSGRLNTSNYRNFYSYLLTCSGLNTTPVKSNQVAPEYGHRWNWGAGALSTDTWDNATNPYDRGALKISWDGTKAATVNHVSGFQDKDEAIMIFDFDNSTGLLSNPKAVSAIEGQWSWQGGIDYSSIYSCEWAPDSKGLFFTSVQGAPSQGIFWLDASLPTAAQITASIKLVSNNFTSNCDIKLGGDARLYQPVYSSSSLRAYSFPNLNDLNSGSNVSVNTLNFTNTINGAAIAMRGLSNMFNPPVDEPEISTPAAICDADAPINLSTSWICSGTNAELANHEYIGNGITNAATGTFDPSIAGVGNHQIIFRLLGACNAIDDTINIQVTPCNVVCGDTTLNNLSPQICMNETYDLSNFVTGGTAAGSWSIVNSPAGSNPATINGSSFDATNADPGIYIVRHTLNGSPLFGCPDSAERTIEVWSLPLVSVNSESICNGDPLPTFTATAPTAVSYQWSDQGTGTNPATSSSSSGTYTVTVEDANSCSNTASGTLTINALPTVSVSNQSICTGDAPATFSAESPTAINYLWSNLGTGTSSTTTGSTAGTYTVTVEDANSCTASTSGTLTVNSLPIVSVNSETICENDPAATFTATAPTAISFLWSEQGSGTSNTVQGSVAGTYTVTVGDVNNCSAQASGTLTVVALPQLDLLTDQTKCTGETIILNPQLSGVIFSWLPGGSSSATIDVSTVGNYTLTVTEPINNCVNSKTISVSDEIAPPLNLSNLKLCPATTIVVEAPSGLENYSKLWSDGSNGSSITIKDIGNYSLEITSPLTCTYVDFFLVEMGSVSSVQLPSDTAICDLRGENITIEAQFSNATQDQLTWNLSGNDGLNNFTISEAPTTLIATVRSSDGCEAKDSIFIDRYCEEPEVDEPNVFTPGGDNPTWTPIGTLTPADVVNSHFEVYNRWGVRMYQTEENIPEWDGTNNGSACSSGVYFWLWEYEDVYGNKHKYNGFVHLVAIK